jgi:hypothetical protein
MREIASPLDGFASPFGGGRRADPIAVFNSWFLSSGTWDATEIWIDAALWEGIWFLAPGGWQSGGIWDDAENWDLTGRFDALWFLRNGRINVFGRWLDSEAWT